MSAYRDAVARAIRTSLTGLEDWDGAPEGHRRVHRAAADAALAVPRQESGTTIAWDGLIAVTAGDVGRDELAEHIADLSYAGRQLTVLWSRTMADFILGRFAVNRREMGDA